MKSGKVFSKWSENRVKGVVFEDPSLTRGQYTGRLASSTLCVIYALGGTDLSGGPAMPVPASIRMEEIFAPPRGKLEFHG